MVDEKQLIGELVKLRKIHFKSQRQFAKELGVSATTIQDIEQGRRSLWLGDVLKWLRLCKTSPIGWLYEFVSLDPGIVRQTNEDFQILNACQRAMHIKNRRDVLKVLYEQWSAADAQADELRLQALAPPVVRKRSR